MKLVSVNIEEYTKRAYSRTKNLKLLEEFINSDMDCAKDEEYDHKDAYSCASSLKKSSILYGLNNINVSVRKGEVLLIKVR